jgi:hypothetical protein
MVESGTRITLLLPLIINDEHFVASCVTLSLDGMFSTFPVQGGPRLVHDNDSEKRLYSLADRSFGKLNEDEDSFGEMVIDILFLGCVLTSLVLSLHPLL